MNILFVNGSPNKDGNTAKLTAKVLGGRACETLDLVDYRINVFGQTLAGDQFAEVIDRMKEADVIVIGSPLYWHNICGSVRPLLDRFYGAVSKSDLNGRKLIFVYQGAAPQKWMMDAGEFTMKRFASLYGLDYLGMATNDAEAAALSAKLG